MDPIASLSTTLLASLSPDPPTRRAAEATLLSNQAQPGFIQVALALVTAQGCNPDMAARLAASVLIKNACKGGWDPEDESPVPKLGEEDKEFLRNTLVPAMISLSRSPSLQVQLGEAVAEVAESDFPHRCPQLVEQLVTSFSATDFAVNNGVLTTAHRIFGKWRSEFRSNELFTEINLVLKDFAEPFLQLFQTVDALLFPTTPTPLPAGTTIQQLAQTILLLVRIFYDFNSQDLPEFFEDRLAVFFGPGPAGANGLIGRYLVWDEQALQGEPDDTTPSPLAQIRAAICEVVELYAKRYEEEFTQLPAFVSAIWELLLNPNTDELLASRAMRFLAVVVKMKSQQHLFASPETLERMCEKIILPNMAIREHEEEMFEDDPAEYIRRDLEASTESDTRRLAATEFTRALMENFETAVTAIVGRYIEQYLQQYAADKSVNWKSKDTAIYLLTSIASRGSTSAVHGVSSTNVLIDVVQFFSNNVYEDLNSEAVHPILQVDAIKYLHTFRNQLTKEQLISVLPLLVKHLANPNYVIHTYAAITIERVLFMKQNGQALFEQADIRPFAESILVAIFQTIQSADTPEKVAENDHMMKCAMRVIITSRQSLIPTFTIILSHLVSIIGEISKNPSNPRFNQYAFESVASLIRFVTAGNPETIVAFDDALLGPCQTILALEVTEFAPFIFQILSQLLELHPPNVLPPSYSALFGPLLHAALWESRGNIPALVRLVGAFLSRSGSTVAADGNLVKALGAFKMLISSRLNDHFGFELLYSLLEFVPTADLSPFMKDITILLLTRMQNSKTQKFLVGFTKFVAFPCAIQKEGMGVDWLIGCFDSVQNGIFQHLLPVINNGFGNLHADNRRIVSVGFAKILASPWYLQQPQNAAWPLTMAGVIGLLEKAPTVEAGANADDELFALDWEDTGYQASYSALKASAPAKRDLVAYVGPDEKRFLSAELAKASSLAPGLVPSLIRQIKAPGVADTWLQYAASVGDVYA
uniref:Importin N-terminal domain-containing protein n=1 Tax=Bartheletia paradoxa TaxID=669517 RepID=A0A2D0XHN9_9BASI|nr:hypothetical protein SPAR07607 [Bartheletia paradoxa]